MDPNKVYHRSPTSSSEHTSSAAAESSSDSGNTEKIPTPPSIIQQKKGSPNKNRNNISTPSKPSTSIKRPREPQEKQASKPSSKKSKKPAQEDKGKAAGTPEAEKSAKRNGPIWNAKDEDAFLKRLVACCEKGKGLPKNSGAFYEAVRKDLDGDYSHEQLYNKMRGLRAKFVVARDKIKDKGFVGFKNAREENLYKMSKQVWGNREGDEEVGTEKAGKGGNARVEKKKKKKNKNKNVVVDPGREREEVKRNKNGDVDMTFKEQEGEEEEDEDESDGEEGEGHDQGEQNVNVNLSQHDILKEMKTKKKNEGISHISESVRNRVAGTGTQRSQVKVLEEEVSSEDNGGEEKDSTEEDEESESESTADENSALRDSNVALILSRSNIGGSSTRRDANIELKQSNVIENSTQHVSNGGSKGSRGVGTAGRYDSDENSRQHVAQGLSDRRKVAVAGHHDARENLSRPLQNGTPDGRRGIATTNLPNNEENSAQHVPNGTANGSPRVVMTDQQQMLDQMCNESLGIYSSQLLDMLDGYNNEIVNIVNMAKKELKNEIVNTVNMTKKELQGASNNARATGFDFSMITGFSSARELPSLSKTEAEMFEQKWQAQQFIEMEAASKHLALLQEEYQLRMAKFRHQ